MLQTRSRPGGGLKMAWIGLILVALIAPAAAYIPHTTWLTSRLSITRDKLGIQRMKVELSCGLTDTDRKPETLYLSKPGLVRHQRADGSLVICRQRKCARREGEAKPVQLPEWEFLRYMYFVESRNGEGWARLLRALRVDTKVDTMTRDGDRVAFVLGAKEWERDRPQFWIDKERFLPLRWMVRDGDGLVDIRWARWGTRVAGDWFPGLIEIRRDGKLIERCETTDVDVNKGLSDDLFKF